jgi:hypothetical protein
MSNTVIECHLTHLVDELRIYPRHDGYAERDDYLAIVTVVWLSDTRVMLRGAKGIMCKKSLLACFSTLRKSGAKSVELTRKAGKRMPFAKLIAEGEHENTWEINLDECF